jgi:hypothetical protein
LLLQTGLKTSPNAGIEAGFKGLFAK